MAKKTVRIRPLRVGDRVTYVGHTERCPHACEPPTGAWLARVGKAARLVAVVRFRKGNAQIRFQGEGDDCFTRLSHLERKPMPQHEHKCPACGQTFLCRGAACKGGGQNKELFEGDGDVYCELCWANFSD